VVAMSGLLFLEAGGIGVRYSCVCMVFCGSDV